MIYRFEREKVCMNQEINKPQDQPTPSEADQNLAALIGLLVKIDKRLHLKNYESGYKRGCPSTNSEPKI
jgi:hypothetical protein